jgi:hypothetical protein
MVNEAVIIGQYFLLFEEFNRKGARALRNIKMEFLAASRLCG